MSDFKFVKQKMNRMLDLLNSIMDDVEDLSKETITHQTDFSSSVSDLSVTLDKVLDSLSDAFDVVEDYEDIQRVRKENFNRCTESKKVRISDLKTVGDVIKCHLMLNRNADLLKHLRSKSGLLDLTELADDSSLSVGGIYDFITKHINKKPNLTLIDKSKSLYALRTDKGAKIYVNLIEW